jgi:hypothetical protein
MKFQIFLEGDYVEMGSVVRSAEGGYLEMRPERRPNSPTNDQIEPTVQTAVILEA